MREQSKGPLPTTTNMHPSLSLVSHPLYHSCELLKAFFFSVFWPLYSISTRSSVGSVCSPCSADAVWCVLLWFLSFTVSCFLFTICSLCLSFLQARLFFWPLFLPILFCSLLTRFLVAFSFVCLFICSSPPFSESLRLHFQSLSLFFFSVLYSSLPFSSRLCSPIVLRS